MKGMIKFGFHIAFIAQFWAEVLIELLSKTIVFFDGVLAPPRKLSTNSYFRSQTGTGNCLRFAANIRS